MRRYPFSLPERGAVRRAFSLVEVSIALSISLMAIVSILSVFIASSRMSVEAVLQNRATMQARSVIDHLTRDVRSASSLVDSFGGYTAGASTLILRLPAVDANGFPIDVDTKFDHVIYHQDDENRLVRRVMADGSSNREDEARVVGSNAQGQIALQGTYETMPDALGAYVIFYKFTAVHTHRDREFDMPLAGSVRLRNKTPGA